jgi:hypothetical protein
VFHSFHAWKFSQLTLASSLLLMNVFSLHFSYYFFYFLFVVVVLCSQTATFQKTNDHPGEGRFLLQGYDKCLGAEKAANGRIELRAKPCLTKYEHARPIPARSELPLWRKITQRIPLERRIYNRIKKEQQ